MLLQALFSVLIVTSLSSFGRGAEIDDKAAEFVANYSRDARPVYEKSGNAAWNYQTNITAETQQAMNDQNIASDEFTLQYGKLANSLFTSEQISQLTDESVKRQLESIVILGTANLSPEEQVEYNAVTSGMEGTYSTATATMPDGRELPLDPDLTEIMGTSRDYQELKWAWKGWHEAAGRPIRDEYEKFVNLSNKASQADNFADTGDYWRSWYEMEDLEGATEDLWNDLQPLYEQLHAYVRRCLYNKYGPDYINLNGPIPAHLLGNMWAQQWGNIFDLVEPYPGKTGVDATPSMIEQNYNVTHMFVVSEEFFTSVGLEKMTDLFWENTMFEKPNDREVTCHASAWDFYEETGRDFRIKMCTVVNMQDLITVHHEMGHIQYYQQYKDQPIPFRGGANPGFHEAVGDTLSLSVSTPAHLKSIGLLDSVDEDYEADINYLMSQALEKIAFLPFGYMIDKWRWRVFDGSTNKDGYQKSWEELRLRYQGIISPVERDEKLDFDPGAKYHIPANTPYIRYFVSFVLQFQFYQAMCKEAGYTDSLYKCDFYNSKEAGSKMAEMLKMGSSRPWPEAMEAITGTRNMSTSSIRDYFAPLTEWLEKKNIENGDVVGWSDTTWRPKGYRDPRNVREFLDNYNSTAEEIFNAQVKASWEYNVNINSETQAASEEADKVSAEFHADQAVLAKQFNPDEVEDETERRLLIKLSDVGKGALSDDKFQELSTANSNMQTAYSTATVNIEGEDLSLDPDLTQIMATSRDYNLLRDAWKGWRDSSGRMMREDYMKYNELQNEVARLNGFPDMGAYWLSAYETSNMEEQLEAVWQEMLPLYQQLHAYARRKLYNYYGDKVINLNGPIPAHLFGNMWAQTWVHIYDILEPYKGKTRPDATAGLIEKGWNATKMFQVADKFFVDMGLAGVSQEFWEKSMLTKPTDRDVVCHASAWDFYDRKDFRVKMCTEVNQDNFVTIHHELGHIQYFLQYKDQPVTFREGANPGFHEAVGDTLALSVGTLDHLYKLGLIDEPTNDEESDINYLMSVALDKLAFIPFGYLIDKWRWDVYSGRISTENMNQGWWDYRLKYQGVAPPVDRSELDFDPAAKFHIANDVPYIRYFVSMIVQFQFYEELCREAGYTGDLFKCDFDGNLEAGKKFSDLLKLGSSVIWENALESFNGSPVMSSSSLINYFKPLLDYLKVENENNKEKIGWPDYSWQPPINTIQGADGKVSLDNSASSLSSGIPLVTMALLAIMKYILE